MTIRGVTIHDDFLPRQYFDRIKNTITSAEFPWFFLSNTVRASNTKNLDDYGLVHNVCSPIFDEKFIRTEKTSHIFDYLEPVCFLISEKLGKKVKNIYRIKINLATHTGNKKIENACHIDLIPQISTNYYSAILYINDNDGSTIIYDEILNFDDDDLSREINMLDKINRTNYHLKPKMEVEPKENRLVIFSGNQIHEGCNPTNSKSKILINFIFSVEN